MARAKKEREKPSPKDAPDEDALAARDDAMARLGGALASLETARECTLTALALFVNPDDDDDGGEREEAIDEAIEAAGAATRGLEAAAEAFKEADVEAGEPWDDEAT